MGFEKQAVDAFREHARGIIENEKARFQKKLGQFYRLEIRLNQIRVGGLEKTGVGNYGPEVLWVIVEDTLLIDLPVSQSSVVVARACPKCRAHIGFRSGKVTAQTLYAVGDFLMKNPARACTKCEPEQVVKSSQ